jgi:isocitrate lyase
LPKDVLKLRGSLKIEHTVATINSKRLWRLLNKKQPSQFLEISSVNNAIKEVEKGAQYILLTSGNLIQQVNAKLRQADQVEPTNKWIVPIIVSIEFESYPNLYENIMQSIGYGAAAIFISETENFVKKLITIRLAADVCGVPLVIIAQTQGSMIVIVKIFPRS